MNKVQTIILKKHTDDKPQAEAAKCFYDEYVQFYMDVLKQLSSISCRYGLYHEENTIVETEISIDENDEAKKIIIHEKWDEEFDSICNPLSKDGFSHVSGSLPPRFVRELVRLIAFGDLIRDQYIVQRSELGDLVIYTSMTRIPDTEESDGGKIANYRTGMDEEACYGYESGNRLTGKSVNISFLQETPEKKWYLTTPYIYGVVLPDLESGKFPEYAQEYEKMQKEIFTGFESDTGSAYEFEDGETDHGEWRICNAQELGADRDGMLTSAQIAECIEKIRKAIRAIDSFNQKVCEHTGRSYSDYNYGALNVNLLMHSDEGELFYVHSDMGDGDNLKFSCLK